MNLLLQRDPSTDEHTYGVLRVDDWTLQTIERPWIPADHLGGTNGISCVPCGTYQLVLHDTAAHPQTWALVNPDLGVWHDPIEVPPSGGRSDVLIHPANMASQLLGCIAPGTDRKTLNGVAMVMQSRLAFSRIKAVLAWQPGHTLEITQ